MVDRIPGGPAGQLKRLDTSPPAGSSKSRGSDAHPGRPQASADASLVERSRAAIAASDGIDREKVEAIKTAIRNGELKIDSEGLAKAFIDFERLTDGLHND